MLSTEKPSPDPPCSQLRASSSDERAYQKLALPEPAPEPEVDLLPKSPLDQTPLPKFSIRDYVFTARSKDIKTNWPFSLKNLQLCLKHGVKEILPPFQPLDAVKNQFSNRCTVKTSKENERKGNSIKEATGINDLVSSDSPDNVQSDHVVLFNSAVENDLPSTTACVSRSEIESNPTNRQSSSSVETDNLLESSVEAEAAAANPPPSTNTENTTRAPSKKSRLIVKFGANPDRRSSEDIGSNSLSISETMGSKVCPVCKTFSSSSNTTLNAHIDQCLSKESTPMWAVDSKLPRHRIKPRKTKLMVDIYLTAKRCTLEELDRRNGTNWAAISTVPAEFTEKSVEDRRLGASQVHHEDTRTVGAVYIDANGTKLRILSKSNDAPPVSKVDGDLGLRKPLKGGKGSKLFPTKKKRWHTQKQRKYLKLAPQTKHVRSSFTQNSQIIQDEERNSSAEGSCWEGHQAESSKLKQPDELGTLRHWVRSKRTGLAHKINHKSGKERTYKPHVAQKLPVEGDQSCVTGSFLRNCRQKCQTLPEKPFFGSENGVKIGYPLKETQENERKEQSPGSKRTHSSSFSARPSNGTVKSLLPSKRKGSQSIKECSFIGEGHALKSPNPTGNNVTMVGRKTVGSQAGPSNDSNEGPRSKVFKNCQVLQMNDARASTSSKKVSSANLPSSFKSKSKSMKKFLVSKNSRERSMADKNKAVAWNSESDEPNNSERGYIANGSGRKRTINKACLGRSNVKEPVKERAVRTSWREEATVCASLCPECCCREGNKCIDSSAGVNDKLQSNVDDPESPINESRTRRNDIVSEPSSQVDFVSSATSFSKALGCEYHRLTSQSNSVRSIENYEGSFSEVEVQRDATELRLNGEMFYADNVVNDIGGQNAHVEEELDSGVGLGNSFPAVDPIPIPGPPGSFLPSPRGMDSEDFQGNSSLIASGAQSQEHYDLVDGGSSDSPISTTSTVSNPMAGGSGVRCSDDTLKSTVFSAVHEKINPEISVAGAEISSENVATVSMAMGMGTQKEVSDGENLKLHKIYGEKGTPGYKNDEQLCCCQRKERISQNLTLNYQESPLLRRRAMPSLVVPALGKKFNFDPDSRYSYLGSLPVVFPPSTCPSSGSEKASSSFINALTDASSLKGSPDTGMKFSGRCDSDSASQSPSNPVLRLMGKNLMVVNKDEDTPKSLAHPQPCAQSNNLTFQYPVLPGVSPSNYQLQGHNYFHHMVPQESMISCHDPHGKLERGFDFRLASSFGGQTNLSKLEAPGQLSSGVFPNQLTNGSFGVSRDSYGYKGEYNLPRQQDQHEKSLNSASRFVTDIAFTGTDCDLRHPDSVARSMKEIIVVDEVPEIEAKLVPNVLRNTESLRDSQVVSSGILIPATHYDGRKANLLPSSHLPDPSALVYPPNVQSVGFEGMSTRQATKSPVKWNCTPEGAGVIQRSPFVAAPSSTGHLSSALYYSPG